MNQDDKNLIKALIFASGMFGLWILSTTILLNRLEQKIDAVAMKVECLPNQLDKNYKGVLPIECFKEEVKE